jgi:hypothetical protein
MGTIIIIVNQGTLMVKIFEATLIYQHCEKTPLLVDDYMALCESKYVGDDHHPLWKFYFTTTAKGPHTETLKRLHRRKRLVMGCR